MDLNGYTHRKTAKIDIVGPLGDETDASVELYGHDSKEYRARIAEIRKQYDGASDEQRGARFILAAVKSWENIEVDGKAVNPDSEEAVSMLMQERFDWFTSQLGSAIYDRSLFFRKRGRD